MALSGHSSQARTEESRLRNTMLRTLFKFNGGVKPQTHKAESITQPIAQAPLPSRLAIPLQQSIGGTPRATVSVGERVLKGQMIGEPDGNMSSSVHAPTSGTVIAVDAVLQPHSSGLKALSVVIEPDGEDRWIERQPFDYRQRSASELRDYLRDMGVVGLGGAVFPSHMKLRPGSMGYTQTLVINGAECEPFITCDDLLMRERAALIVRGIEIMRSALQAKEVLIGIEDNKPEAIAAMQAAVAAHGDHSIQVIPVPTRYPAGGAKELIRVLAGIKVPQG